MSFKKIVLGFIAIGIISSYFMVSIPAHLPTTKVPAHPIQFFDEQYFQKGVQYTQKNPLQKKYIVSGGIVPHHLLVGFIIADFFNRISIQNPKTIILIGPNHYEKGESKIITGTYNWNTPFGIVNTDNSRVSQLVGKSNIQLDEKVLGDDHSVAGLMPFIRFYLPNTQVVPILVKNTFDEKEIDQIVEALVPLIDKDTVIVASVDFSHYLSSQQAEEKDEVTIEAIRNFNHEKLLTFNSDYLDSPASTSILLKLMQRQNTTMMDILHHTNAGIIENKKNDPTTSYFSILYY